MPSRRSRSALTADAGYPSARLVALAQQQAASLAGVQSGGFPAQQTLAVGDYAFVAVATIKGSGKFLVSGTLSYALGTATSALWYWNLLSGFTVNGGAPVPGIFIHPTIVGAGDPILETGALVATPTQVVCSDFIADFSPGGTNPLPLGSTIGFGLQLFFAGGSGTVSAGVPGGSPFRKGGLLYLQELAG